MHRPAAQLLIHLLIPLLIAGCSSKRDAERRQGRDVLAKGLQESRTPLGASLIIAEAEFSSCASLEQGLAALEDGPWRGSAMRGLVEEMLQRGYGLCDATKTAAWRPGVATSLARSLMEEDAARAVATLTKAPRAAVVLQRRAELYFAMGRDAEGREILIDSLRLDDDNEVRALAARLIRLSGDPERARSLCQGYESDVIAPQRVAALSALGRADEVHRELANAAIHIRPELAVAAIGASKNVEELVALPTAGPEVLLAAARAEGISSTIAVRVLRRATELDRQNADLWIALAEAEEVEGEIPAAIAAWDRAAALAPGAQRPVLAPIRLLASVGDNAKAVLRALKLSADARAKKNAEALHLASLAFRYAGDVSRAVAHAEEAVALRPGEGRLQSELAHRLEEAERVPEAAKVLSRLLVCGSRGRPWHRHEVAARLVALVGADAVATEVAAVACAVVDPEGLRSQLAEER